MRAPVAQGLKQRGLGKPVFSASSNGSIRVKHREYLINLNTVQNEENPLALPINPGDTVTFPWLSQTAINYEQYTIHSMTVLYEPFVSTTVTGSVSLFCDYDPNDSPPTTKAEILNSMGAGRSPVWSNFRVPLLAKELNSNKSLYVRAGTRGNSSSNFRLTDAGTVFAVVTDALGTGDNGNTSIDVGEIWVEYDIELRIPSLHHSEVSSSRLLSDIVGAGPGYPTETNPTGNGTNLGAVEGSSVKYERGRQIEGMYVDGGNPGKSIIKFDEDFEGQLEITTYNNPGLTPPSLMVGGVGFVRNQLDALVGEATDFLDTTAQKYIHTVEIVAMAGQGIGILIDAVTDPWGTLAQVGIKMLPYARRLMGNLLRLDTASNAMTHVLRTCQLTTVTYSPDQYRDLADAALQGVTVFLTGSFDVPRAEKWALLIAAEYA